MIAMKELHPINKNGYAIRVSTYDQVVDVKYVPQSAERAREEARRYIKEWTLIIELYYNKERIWYWTPVQGEKELSKFATAVAAGRGTFVTSALKKQLAQDRVTFTVSKVVGPEWNKEMRTDEYTLTIHFDPSTASTYRLSETMTLSIGSVPKASREDRVKALQEDAENSPVHNVLLTYDPNVGRNGWYDLDLLVP